jgi:hypothetical protein
MSLAVCLQGLFTTTAEALGRSAGFIQRQRHLTAADFAQTPVFQWLARPDTTLRPWPATSASHRRRSTSV